MTDHDHPLSEVGALTLLLIKGEVFVAGRQPDAIHVCLAPLPEPIVAEAMARGAGAIGSISAWLVAETRRFILILHDARIVGLEVADHEQTGVPGVTAARCRVLTDGEVIGTAHADQLMLYGIVLGRQVFPAWAADDASASLGDRVVGYMPLGVAEGPEA